MIGAAQGCRLLDVEHETFEVFALGMVDVDGVVGGLVELMENADVATALGSSCEHRETELVLVDCLRTREGEDNSAWLDFLKGDGVETRVAFESIAQGILVLSKGWRVEHDEVVVATCAVEKSEGVFGISLVARIFGEVEGDVAACEFDSLGRDIDAMYTLGTATHRVDGEATSVAEHIEHRAAFGILLQEAAVVALVDEETRLLAVKPVDVEFQSVFEGDVFFGLSAEETIFLLEVGLEGEGGFALIIDVLDFVFAGFEQGVGNGFAVAVHTHAVSLDDGRLVENIDDEARELVALAVDKAVDAVEVGDLAQAEAGAEGEGLTQAPHPEVVVDRLVDEGEHTNGDRTDLVVAFGDKLTFGIDDADDFALLQRGLARLCALDGT